MNWELHRAELLKGQTIQIRPKGNSMSPKIESGQLVTIAPIGPGEVKKGDIVFCSVNGRYYVHLVEAVMEKLGGFRYQIGNNKKHTNGTVGENKIFGKVIKVEN